MAGLDPGKDDQWTSEQFSIVLRKLCASKYGAVPRQELAAALGSKGGEAVVALLKANYLGLRPRYSLQWEQQLSAEAWGEESDQELVTAGTAPMMYAMRKAIKRAEAQLAKAKAAK